MKKSAHQSGQAPKLCKHTSGQALLIILLVMAVGLTIALSIVSRSVTDIRISREQEESARAFSVAEAGIEESLRAGSATDVTLEGITAQVTETAQGGETEFVFEKPVDQGDTQTVWLVEHDSSENLIETPFYTAGSLDVCWEDTEPETALEVSIFYKDGGIYKVARGAYDAEAGFRGNGFDSPDAGSCAGLGRKKTLTWGAFGISLDVDTFLLSLRLRPLYNSAKIGAAGAGGSGGILPIQGKCYESSATVPESGITRKVRQCRSYPVPPAIFDYVLFSGSGLTK